MEDQTAALRQDIAALAAQVQQMSSLVQAQSQRLAQAVGRLRGAGNIFLGDHTALGFLENGYLMLVDTRDRAVGIHLLHGGRWETQYTEAFRRLLRPGATVVDVGANLGWYTLVSAPLVGPSGRVIAVEPNPHLAKLLTESVHINGFSPWVSVLQTALSDAPGVVDLIWDTNVPGGGFIRPAAATVEPFARETTRVLADRLDTLIVGRVDVVDVLKMDVEGWEGVALRGMTAILDRSPGLRMMIEWSPGQDHTPAPRAEAAAMLGARGYVPHRVALDGTLLRSDWAAALAMVELDNLVLLSTGDPLTAA